MHQASIERGQIDQLQMLIEVHNMTLIINWVVRALNADWLKAVVYQTVYHKYDKTFRFTLLIRLVTGL